MAILGAGITLSSGESKSLKLAANAVVLAYGVHIGLRAVKAFSAMNFYQGQAVPTIGGMAAAAWFAANPGFRATIGEANLMNAQYMFMIYVGIETIRDNLGLERKAAVDPYAAIRALVGQR